MLNENTKRSLRLGILVSAAVMGLVALYGSRRIPVTIQQGSTIHWPTEVVPISLKQIRLGTYNIHRGKGLDGMRDLDRVAEVIRTADLLALNEVGGPAFFGQPDQAEQLGQAVKIGWLYAPNQRRWFMDYFGNALLSRIPLKSWSHEPLVHHRTDSRSYRNLLRTRFHLKDQPIEVFITHLDRGAIRTTQLQFVVQLFQTTQPAILMGDLNSTKKDPVLAALLAESTNVDAIGVALADLDPQHRIDWIITRGLQVLKGGIEPVGVSDHPYFWVEVTLPDANVPLLPIH